MKLNNDFELCVKRKLQKGVYSIECKLGLWGVESSNLADVNREANHYFMQYKLDGEYSSIIGGNSVLEVFINNMTKEG